MVLPELPSRASLLTAPYVVALLHLDAVRLQVGVEGVPPATDVDDHVVAPGVLQRQVGVNHAGLDVGVLVHDLHNLAVCHREDRLAVGGEIREPAVVVG